MIHRISELCDKIDSIKAMSDRLRESKYGLVKAPREIIDESIQSIQAECLLIANDKSKYNEPHDQEDKE
jgi:hypothetical protein